MYRFTIKITRPNVETDWPGEYRGDDNNLDYDEQYAKITNPTGQGSIIYCAPAAEDIGEDLYMIHKFHHDSHDEIKLKEFHDKYLDTTSVFYTEVEYYENLGFTVEISDVAERIFPSANT